MFSNTYVLNVAYTQFRLNGIYTQKGQIMSTNTVRSSSDKEWKRAKEKYPIGSDAAKLAAEHPYDTVEANFPNSADDPFKADILPKHNINLDSVLKDVKNAIHPSQEKVEETKEMLKNFKEKVANYPKYLTYEGSVVLCVMLSINESKNINLNGLPLEDKTLILSLLPQLAVVGLANFDATLKVEFDSERDFVLTYTHKNDSSLILKFFNTVIHPKVGDDTKNVPIENEGETISLGSTLVLDKKRIQKLIGVDRFSTLSPSVKSLDEEEIVPRRQPVSGRNAFELRTDLINMSMDLLFHNDKGNIPPEEVVKTAKVLYAFVENRR